MAIETAIAAVDAAGISEAAVMEAAEATVAQISGATELSETLSAIEKEIPREIINEKVDAMLQNEAFHAEILEETKQIFTINEHLEGTVHPETNVPFAIKEIEIDGESRLGVFPDFSASYEAQLPETLHEASDYEQATHCNEQLSQSYENGSLDTEQFTDRQLEQIRNGDKPEGYIWHHHEDSGRMQLVPSDIHEKTGHTGGRSLWGGGSESR
ncbi:MAG: HNH endonuclease [Gemmatimonadetes bacterium]|nr:HNH endonuclease [Gemmatimonadota bacterium]